VSSRPRLLFLSGLFPLPVRSGGQQRTMHLLRALQQRFDVTVVTHAAQPGFEAHLDALRRSVTRLHVVVPRNMQGPLPRFLYKVWFWTRRLTSAEPSDRFYNNVGNVRRVVDRELADPSYDVVFCMYWFWHARVYAAPPLKVIDTNDVQTERQAEFLARSRNVVDKILGSVFLRSYRKREAATLRRADLLVAVTSKDRETLQAMAGPAAEVIVVPTGIDTDHLCPQPLEPDMREIVFFGALRNRMNQDAVPYLVREILPRIAARLPDVRLTLVGSSPTAEMHQLAAHDPRVHITGFVEDLRPVLGRAGLVVCPLRFAYGIRGRILEVLSLGVPVVATPVAVDGMGVTAAAGVVLADDAQSFADAVVEILAHPARRAELSRQGRDFAVANASLAATFGRLADDLANRVAIPGAAASERVR